MILPSFKSDPRIDAFVNHNWLSLAGAAYRYCLRLGRGALMMSFDTLSRWERGEAFTLEPQYITTMDYDQFESLTATYDPETSIVVFFTTDDDAVRITGGSWGVLKSGTRFAAYVYKLQPPPPEAHKRTAQG